MLPTPTLALPVCQDNLTFIEDLTVPDGTYVDPGVVLDKRWKVRNSGSCNWDEDYRFKLIDASTNGTYVNGERVNGEWLLMNGDTISLGSDIVLEYNEGTPPAAAPRNRWLKPLGWLGGGVLALVAALLARS